MACITKKLIIFFIFTFTINSINCNNTHVMKLFGSRISKSKSSNSTGQINEDDNDTYILYDLQIVENVFKKIDATQCSTDMVVVLNAVSRREKWAMQLLDASAKFPIGLLYGAYYQFGNFDECIEVKQPQANPPIKGQYCLADIDVSNGKNEKVSRSLDPDIPPPRNLFNNTIHWGICIPHSCTTENVEMIVREILDSALNHREVSVKIDQDKCHYERSEPVTPLEIIYGCIIGLFLIMTLLATAFHYNLIQKRKKTVVYNVETVRTSPSTVKEVILCFSLIQTTSNFLKVKPSDLNLECICGIKLISMCFIIVGHSLLFSAGGPVQNTIFFDKELTKFSRSFFVNSPLLVDTFLLISGFLLCLLLLKEFEKRKGKVNILILYIARFIRLTPSYLVVIGLYCTFLIRLGSGPLWDSRIGLEQKRCLKSWWTNVLYVNNYVSGEDMCMFQSWYLAVDYHLFIIAPFIIYVLWRWPKWGKILLGICIGVGVLIPFCSTLIMGLDPTLLTYSPEVVDLNKNYYFINVYVKTHMRSISYSLGILFGFIIHQFQTKGMKVCQLKIWIGWFVSVIFGVVSMGSVTIFYLSNHKYNALEAAVYASLHRVGWCTLVGWVLVVCITDNAVYVNKFLSWKLFVPLSRLTYCAYLVNGFIELYNYSTVREAHYMSTHTLAIKCTAHVFFTFGLAFILCILFESPIHGLEKILLRKGDLNLERRKSAGVEPIEDS